jgi:hypothetical protein
MALHQDPLRALDDRAPVERRLELIDLDLQPQRLLVAAQRDLDRALSGSSRAISSAASATDAANGITSCPRPSRMSPSARRSSSRSLARRIRRLRSLVVVVSVVIVATFFYTPHVPAETPAGWT